MQMSRRGLLTNSGLALGSVLLLSACKTVTDGATTTVTLDTKKIQAYGTAGLNAAKMVVAVLGATGTMSAFVVPFTALIDTLQTDLDAFSTGVGTQTTIVYDDSSVKSLVDSVFTDIRQIMTLVNSAMSSATAQNLLSSSLLSKVNVVSMSLQTIVSVFAALIGAIISTASNGEGMTEADALQALGVN